MSEARRRDGVRRVRVSLRTLLILVTVAGVIFGLMGRTIRYENARAKGRAVLREQYTVTDNILVRARTNKWLQSRIGPNIQWRGGSGSGHSGPSEWNVELSRWGRIPEECGISIEIEGGLNDLGLKEITIFDRESLYNRLVIEELTEAYAKKKWADRIVGEQEVVDAPDSGESS